MDYKEMWEQLKKETEQAYERLHNMYLFAQIKDVSQNEIDELRKNRDLFGSRLQQMIIMEDKQAKTSREEIEHALYKLVYDNAMCKFRIKRLVFTEENAGMCEEHYIEHYGEYRLFQDGKGWFIVFYSEGESVEEFFHFDKVTIEYNKQETKR